MRTLERAFAGPHGWWDEYVERVERDYAELTEGMTCLDCGRCRRSERHQDEGFCMREGEFVDGDETVAQRGLECFEAA